MKKYYMESRGRVICIYTKMKANWIGHVLLRNCLLKHVVEGKRQGRNRTRNKLLLDDLKRTTIR